MRKVLIVFRCFGKQLTVFRNPPPVGKVLIVFRCFRKQWTVCRKLYSFYYMRTETIVYCTLYSERAPFWGLRGFSVRLAPSPIALYTVQQKGSILGTYGEFWVCG